MLLHLSFREFLFDPQTDENCPFWVDERKTHEKLTSNCIQLMSSSKGLKQNICNLLSPGALRSEIDKQTIDYFLNPKSSTPATTGCTIWSRVKYVSVMVTQFTLFYKNASFTGSKR